MINPQQVLNKPRPPMLGVEVNRSQINQAGKKASYMHGADLKIIGFA